MIDSLRKNPKNFIMSELRKSPDFFTPLMIDSVTALDEGPSAQATRPSDFLLNLIHRNRTYIFEVKAKGRSAPSVVRSAIDQLRTLPPSDRNLMIAVPNLSPGVVGLLSGAGICGMDLNGNYLIITPQLIAIRLDRPNRYAESGSIRNIYTGNSSIVGRYLLIERGSFHQVNQIHNGIKKLGGNISLATVSKVLKKLNEELILRRTRYEIDLVQPRKLLEKLRLGYQPPKPRARLRLKLPGQRSDMERLLTKLLGAEDWIWSGESSAEAYAITTPMPILSAYTRAKDEALRALQGFEESRFYNCELLQTEDAFVYFARNGQWASRIESYFALAALGKREQEIAADIEQTILHLERDHA